MKLRTATVLAAVAAMTAVAAAPEPADVTTTVDGTTLTVTGTLTDGLGAAAFVGDAAGDAVVNGAGHDLVGGTISFPAPNRVAYSLEIVPNQATGFVPYGAQYQTTLSVGGGTYELIANALPTGLSFASQTCEPGPGGQSCTSSPVDGSYADGVLTWELDAPNLPGNAVSATEIHTAIQANFVAGPTLTLVGTTYDSASQNAIAAVPGAQLLLNGEAVGQLGRLTDQGFSLTADDVAPGTYTVGVELCSAIGECLVADGGEVTVEDESAAEAN